MLAAGALITARASLGNWQAPRVPWIALLACAVMYVGIIVWVMPALEDRQGRAGRRPLGGEALGPGDTRRHLQAQPLEQCVPLLRRSAHRAPGRRGRSQRVPREPRSVLLRDAQAGLRRVRRHAACRWRSCTNGTGCGPRPAGLYGAAASRPRASWWSAERAIRSECGYNLWLFGQSSPKERP